ncbi:FAD-dependent oxidoreductase [Herbiconiux sp. CPCC 205763]|uniref:FAD-dependent oxidoreductase n=1 Tax=Herbiconiux aconitum TaxID=2970913 RepID=A0ABT2GVA4_9MICO|nr:FAD-dependent oxidoreductase [Herbiconiux aconitum]MCS5718864.1 FAD-dependent oxidoreductase [Herbiconiux aconitum]
MHGDDATPALERTFSPWRLGALELPHRVITGSMHTGLETLDDGGAALSAYYAERIQGGAALIITGGLAVNAEGCGADDFSVLGDPASDARFAAAATAVHEAGGFIAAQLFHAGRYALLDGVTDAEGRPVHPVAPSPLAWRSAGAQVPVELDEAGIRRTIDDFRIAAERAVELGFDAVEIMASEGYLINQFCSPVTNRRDDEWGGDARRRRRFAVEVLRAVRQGVGIDVPVIVRMSGADLVPDSTTQDETDALARDLVRAGADALNVGIGWHESKVPTVQAAVPHGVWLRYAEAVARAIALPGDPTSPSAVPVIASNRLTDLRDAEDILARGTITAVALARPFLADAAIVDRSRNGHFDAVNSCIGCNQACLDRSFVKQPVSCLVNPRAGTETRYPLTLSAAPAHYAVVGGGPAGLIAATDLASRGNRVTLYEADAHLGGQFTLAARIPTKEDYALTVAHYAARLSSLGARVELSHPVTVEELAAGGYAGVVVATGVRPRAVEIEGSTLPHVLSYERAILDGVPPGRVAIIGGGGIGIDTAKFLVLSHDPAVRARAFEEQFQLASPSTFLESDALPQRTRVRERPGAAPFAPRPGNSVTVLRRTGKFGAGMGITSRWVALGELREAGVQMLSDLDYRRITPSGVEVVFADGTSSLVPADVVIVCAGQVSHDPLSAGLAARGTRHEVVGGALDASRVDAVRATRQGIDAARRLAA